MIMRPQFQMPTPHGFGVGRRAWLRADKRATKRGKDAASRKRRQLEADCLQLPALAAHDERSAATPDCCNVDPNKGWGNSKTHTPRRWSDPFFKKR
jgi:hypothetical protein